MVTPIRAAGAVAVVVAVGLVGATEPAARPEPASAGVSPVRAVGLAGCAGTACHGRPAGDRNAPAWETATAVWFTTDPHRRAYAALDTPLGQKIGALIPDSTGEKVPATANDRCLACHTDPALAPKTTPPEAAALRADGVSCEACHGPADAWLRPHTTWRSQTDRSEGLGETKMAELNDHGQRALVCLGCHVGAPADPGRGYPVRDMNHDMIAAGHPRLNFDYATYLDLLPRHWQEKDRTKYPPGPRGPEFEARGWLVGRVAHAEAACRLLEDRATRAAPWPEFAEFNCFSCHHDLRPDGWRKDIPPSGDRPPGAAPWQTVWPVTDPSALGQVPGAADAAAAVAEVLKVMEGRWPAGNPKRGRPPKAEAAKTAAEAAGGKLKALRESLSAAKPAASLAVFSGVRVDRLDWDEACQVVHGLDSLDRARGRPGDAETVAAFGTAYKNLTLPRPPGRDSFDSPRDYDPAATRAAIEMLLKAVPDATKAKN